MEERKLTEKESLEVITSMIARTKQRYLGGGNILLMWGYLVAIVTLAVWLTLVFTHNEVWNWLWFAIPLIGGIKLLANWYMPIFIFAWVAMMIVPGHVLNRKARQA